MKNLIVILMLLLAGCSDQVEKRPIHVHISSGVDSALVVFESEDSVRVINYKQKKDSVKPRSKTAKPKSNLTKPRKKKESKPQKQDPCPSFGVPRI